MKNRVKTHCEVSVYEENGQEVPIGNPKTVNVLSHWNRGDMVVLEIGDGDIRVTVVASDIIAAVNKARA